MLNYIHTRSIDDVRTTTILLFTLSAFVGVNEVRVLLLIVAEMNKEIGRGLFFFILVFRVGVTKRGKLFDFDKTPQTKKTENKQTPCFSCLLYTSPSPRD